MVVTPETIYKLGEKSVYTYSYIDIRISIDTHVVRQPQRVVSVWYPMSMLQVGVHHSTLPYIKSGENVGK